MPRAESASAEFALIERFFSGLDHGPGIRLGLGDDAAVVALAPDEELVVSTDTQLEGRHFPESSDPEHVAYRAVACAASDLAAMGAAPRGMTLAISLPGADEMLLSGLRRGLARAANEFSMPLIGGDTTRGTLALTVTVLGACPSGQALRRDGARPGDRLCVSGDLGDAAAGLALLSGELDLAGETAAALRNAFWLPQPRLALGNALRGVASAAIDVSDGLLADAGHLAARSGVGIVVYPEKLPLSPALGAVAGGAATRERALAWALAGGDDYQLCFTLPEAAALPGACTVIGEVVSGAGITCEPPLAPAVMAVLGNGAGYDHFSAGAADG